MYFGGFEHLHNLLGEASDVHGAVVWRFWDYQRLGHVMFGRLLNKHAWLLSFVVDFEVGAALRLLQSLGFEC